MASSSYQTDGTVALLSHVVLENIREIILYPVISNGEPSLNKTYFRYTCRDIAVSFDEYICALLRSSFRCS